MNHEDTMQSEIGQTQKEKYCLKVPRIVKFIEQKERRVGIARGQVKEELLAISV
jgi:hypothetical protein